RGARARGRGMLPDKYLHLRLTDDLRVLPLWLTERDDVWLRIMADTVDALDGKPVEEALARLRSEVGRAGLAHGVPWRIVDGVWTVERRRWKAACASPVEPTRIRAVTFALAAERPRDEALATAAQELGMSAEDVERF